MAIQQLELITLSLLGDGAATTFVFGFNKLFAASVGDPSGLAGMVLNSGSVPTAANVINTSTTLPSGANAALDGFGNLTITFPSPPGAGVSGQVQVQLQFNSNVSLSGTTQAWTSATAANTTWVLPLSGSNGITVGFIVSGSITGGVALFQVSQDGASWLPIQGSILNGFTTLTGWQSGVGSQAVQFDVTGFSYFRLILNPALVGSGTLTFIIQASNLASQQQIAVGQSSGVNLHATIDDGSGSGLTANVTTKGAQGANALTVQRQLDAGRTPIVLTCDSIAGVTGAEALITLVTNKGGVTGSASQYTVTAGKTLRVQSIFLSVRASTAAIVSCRARLRAGAVVNASSPIFNDLEASNPTPTTTSTGNADSTIPDGLEFAAGQQLGISQVASATTALISVCAVGFEY